MGNTLCTQQPGAHSVGRPPLVLDQQPGGQDQRGSCSSSALGFDNRMNIAQSEVFNVLKYKNGDFYYG